MRNVAFQILLLLLATSLYAQTSVSKKEIEREFESFEYAEVIKDADQYLYSADGVTKEDSIDVLTMKGIAHYSLGEENGARSTFKQIIILNPNHKLNPVSVSPKIIDLFEEVKSNFVVETKVETKQDEQQIIPLEFYKQRNDIYKNSIARSVVVPGWGHLYVGNKTKGWVLTSLSTAALGSMIYFIADTQTKEKDYLNETNQALIEQKYSDYNSSYKMRNAMIASYAAIWIYTQIDLLFNQDEYYESKLKMSFSTNGNTYKPGNYQINLSYSF